MSQFRTYDITPSDKEKFIIAKNEKIISVRAIYLSTIALVVDTLFDFQIVMKSELHTHVIKSWKILDLSNTGVAVYQYSLENTTPRVLDGKTDISVTGWHLPVPNVEKIVIETETIA